MGPHVASAIDTFDPARTLLGRKVLLDDDGTRRRERSERVVGAIDAADELVGRRHRDILRVRPGPFKGSVAPLREIAPADLPRMRVEGDDRALVGLDRDDEEIRAALLDPPSAD